MEKSRGTGDFEKAFGINPFRKIWRNSYILFETVVSGPPLEGPFSLKIVEGIQTMEDRVSDIRKICHCMLFRLPAEITMDFQV
jgi:hypothetical protein